MRRSYAALAVAGVVIVLLVIAQLVLPGIAAQRIRDQLKKSGRVLDVEVSAFPAVELLWHQADDVKVRMARYHASNTQLSNMLAQAADAGTLTASVQTLTDGLLTVHRATVQKQGSALVATAQVKESDLRSAVPGILQSVTPVASSQGQLVLRGTANVLGARLTIDAVVEATGGNLQVTPNVPFGGLATLTLFSDPHVAVESLSATPSSGGFSVSARGTLH